MDGMKQAVEVLRLLAHSPRLTPYERDAVKYALVLVEERYEIEQTFYSEVDTSRGLTTVTG